ncbi:MAG TPA: hypothetical protein VJB87_04395 [Candidatus Nanoarchaeia archaeon]|nr:hypothetical protein [Candidatus Nanoarchaeia archaeon]
MSEMCGVCHRTFSSHKCERCNKEICEIDWNILAKTCIVCVPRKSSVNRSYGLPHGN